MEGSKYTDGDVVDQIEHGDGLEYSIRHKFDSRHIESEKTGKLWDAAAKALNDLVDHLERSTGRYDF